MNISIDEVKSYFKNLNLDDYNLSEYEITDEDYEAIVDECNCNHCSIEDATQQYLYNIHVMLDCELCE